MLPDPPRLEERSPASPQPAPSAPATGELIAALRAGRTAEVASDLRGARLIGADLSGLDLAGVDLGGADLSRSDLSGCNLLGARLADATLFEADLSGAEVAGADLTGANLQRANLTNAGLGRSSLRAACLSGADLTGASLTEADLGGADLRAADLTRLRALEADLTGTDLSLAALREATLDRSSVDGAIFDGADLRGSSLMGLQGYKRASWIGVDLRNIDFTGAHLCRSFILDQNYINEFRSQSRWNRVLYEAWRLTSDCGRSVTRWAFCTVVLVLLFAFAYTLVGVDYGRHPTLISPLYYSVVTLTTLGYGDVTPSTIGGQIVAMLEVVTGYVMLGGLLSIFSNKMASRAE